MKNSLWKKPITFLIAFAVMATSVPVTGLEAEAAGVDLSDYELVYGVDCGDFDVTTPPAGEKFGTYQSVSEQVYGVDEKTGYSWGIVDEYEVTPPEANLVVSEGQGIRTNWTWAQENGGHTANSSKAETNRYTKNQWEEKTSFGTTRMLEYAFQVPEGDYYVEVCCVDPWGVSTYPQVYLNYEQGSQKQFTDFAVGQVQSQSISLTEPGEITVNFTGTGDKTKAINVAYINIYQKTASDPEPGEKTKVSYEDILPYYNVDCGDFDVTTPPDGESFGSMQSVTEQIYGEDEGTGYTWGILDNYDTAPPSANLAPSEGQGIRTNWTWSQENGGFSIDSPKTVTNRYTKNQWEEEKSFGTTRKLDYSFELPEGTYEVELACVDPWNCSTNPMISLNLGKDSQVDFGSYTAGNKVSKEITLTDQENLTVNFRGMGDKTKAINVAYIMISNPEYKNLYEDYVSADVEDKVKGDFNLVQGTNGNEIAWTSSNEEVIRINGSTAEVTRGQQNEKVTLKAVISNSKYYVEKEMQVTVSSASVSDSNIAVKDFKNTQVEITDDYYVNSYNKEVDYLVSLETDRLLAGFRETAGFAAGYDSAQRAAFMRNQSRYDGWENTLIGGHTLGHYMSAIAQAYVNPQATEEQKTALKAKIDACADGLKECQDLTKGSTRCKEGYLFGATIPNSDVLESQFNKYDGQGASSGDWVAWYTMHKILAGLVDLYKYAGNETALETAVNLGIWTYNRVDQWDAATKQRVLNVEYGGMNDALYELYACIENNSEYSQYRSKIQRAAEQFDETSLFERVKNGGSNILNNKHANTTIPKFIGALKRYIVLGEDETIYLEYAEKFWDMVINHHTYLTGGNSENEHFGADDILYGERTTVNCETCNTYNMLKLTRELYKITGDKKYADYYENTLINAIMSSQNPETGMSMYFQPMATGYQKVFGKPTTDFWCCTGSGMENFIKLNDSIYFHMDDSVIVNQYLSSDVIWEEKNVKLSQKSGIAHIESEESVIRVEALDDSMESRVTIALRIPNWVADQGNTMKVLVNGNEIANPIYFDFEGKETYTDAVEQQRYIAVEAEGGDTITVQTPMETAAYNLPDGDGKNTYAFKYGPVILSAKLGNDPGKQTETSHGVAVRKPSTSAVTSDRVGIYGAETVEEYMEHINENMVRTAGNVFRLQGANFTYDFVPHYSQYTDNYGIYWTYYVGAKDSASIINEKDTNRKNRVIIDSLQAGYGQYEPGLDPDTGNVGSSTEHIRYATAGGYFEYEIKVDDSEKNYLLLTLRREDDGKPLKVTSGGVTVFSSEGLDSSLDQVIQGLLSDSDFAKYYQVKVEIPEAAMKGKYENSEGYDVVKFRFEGTQSKESARLYNWSYCVRGYEDTNSLTNLQVEGKEADLAKKTYSLDLGAEADFFTINAKISDSKGYVAVNGAAIEEGQDAKIELTGYESSYRVEVFAENFEVVETFVIHVKQDITKIDFSGNIQKYYSFDETLGDAKTVQKASVPSEIGKAVSYTAGATEKSGAAINLDGTYGLMMGSAAGLGESYTVSFWMKPESIGKEVDPTFCAGTFSPEYWLSATFDARIWSRHGDYISTNSANAYKSGEWQYVSIVVDGSKEGSQDGRVTGTLYVNGQEVSGGDVAEGIMTNSNAMLYFGVNAWDAYFKGAIDDLMMLNVALEKREINAFMDGTIGTDGKVPSVDDGKEEIAKAKASLAAKASEAEKYQSAEYTEESFQDLQDAVAEALKVIADDSAQLEDVQKAASDLQAALDNLKKPVVVPDDEEKKKIAAAKTELQKKITEAQGYQAAGYTTETFAALTNAIAAGKNMILKANAALEEVNAAIIALDRAVAGLKKAETVNPKPEPETPSYKGKTVRIGNYKYQITKQNAKAGEAAFAGAAKKKASVTIPASVKYKGITFKVTSVKANAMKGNAKVTKLVIGKNVKTIGKKAFYGCKKLKSIRFNSKNVTKIKPGAFLKIKINAVVKAPGAAKRQFKKMLTKKVISKTVTIKWS